MEIWSGKDFNLERGAHTPHRRRGAHTLRLIEACTLCGNLDNVERIMLSAFRNVISVCAYDPTVVQEVQQHRRNFIIRTSKSTSLSFTLSRRYVTKEEFL